jgi:LPS export ABC transporter protein LptC
MKIEKLSTHRFIRTLRVLIPLVVLVLISIPAWNYFSRRRLEPAPPQALSLPKDLALRTEGFTYSQTEGGRTVFSIKAKTNLGFTDSKYMLEEIAVTIYGTAESDPPRMIRSKTGSYDEKAGSFTFSGEVEAELDEKTTGRTAELTYNHANRLIASQHRTTIEQPGTVTADANSLEYGLDSGLLSLAGDVRVRTAKGAALESGAAQFHQKENWATVTGGVYLASSNGWIRGETGRAELEPGTFKPKKIVIGGGVSAQSSTMKLRSGVLEAALDPDGNVESVKARGEVEAESLDRQTKQVLTGSEIDATMDAAGKLQMLEARENAHMTMGANRALSSSRIRTDGENSIVTFDGSAGILQSSRATSSSFLRRILQRCDPAEPRRPRTARPRVSTAAPISSSNLFRPGTFASRTRRGRDARKMRSSETAAGRLL